MSEIERHNAIGAMRQAERLVNAFLWARKKLADAGQVFLKPSLKH